MIRSFGDKDTERLALGSRVARFAAFERVALRKLRQLQVADALSDLRVPPGNRLEALAGDREGQYSIRINEQFRICFRWTEVPSMLRSSTITEVSDPAAALAPVTPGELLKEEFLVPMGISQYRLAKETGIPAQRIGQIILGRRSITADTDLRLCRFFGLSDGYWLRAQVAYDIEVARRKLEPELKKIVPLSKFAAAL